MPWADQPGLSDISPPPLGFAEPGTHVHPWTELPQVHLFYHVNLTLTSHSPSADNWSSSSFSPTCSSQSILCVATFLALHHGRGGALNSAEPFSFMVVPLKTGQPVFKVPVPGPTPVASSPSCQSPLGEIRNQTVAAQWYGLGGTAIESSAPQSWCLSQCQFTSCFVGYWPTKRNGQLLTANLLELWQHCQHCHCHMWEHWAYSLCKVQSSCQVWLTQGESHGGQAAYPSYTGEPLTSAWWSGNL